MNKTIFIYFSYSGDNDNFANILQRELNCDILKLQPEKKYTNSSIKILFQGGNEALRKKAPALIPYNFDSSKYSTIIFGTPVWAWTLSPVIRTFLQDNTISNKDIVLTCSHRGSPGHTIDNLIQLLPNNNIIFNQEIHAPIADNYEIIQIIDGIKKAREVASD